jgi:hypothetical protein
VNGKGQFYLNLAITLMFGFYGVVGALFSELTKPDFERRGYVLATEVTICLALAAGIIDLLLRSRSSIKDDRE